MTLLIKKLRPTHEMGFIQGQWHSSDQNPDFSIPSQVRFKRSWFAAFQKHGNWVQKGFSIPLGIS